MTAPRAAAAILAHIQAQLLVLRRTPAQLVFLLLSPAIAFAGIVLPQPGLAAEPTLLRRSWCTRRCVCWGR